MIFIPFRLFDGLMITGSSPILLHSWFVVHHGLGAGPCLFPVVTFWAILDSSDVQSIVVAWLQVRNQNCLRGVNCSPFALLLTYP